MILAISSPSISTTGFWTLIFSIAAEDAKQRRDDLVKRERRLLGENPLKGFGLKVNCKLGFLRGSNDDDAFEDKIAAVVAVAVDMARWRSRSIPSGVWTFWSLLVHQ